MSINTLYSEFRDGNLKAEEKLFRDLSDRFGFFVQQRIWDEQDALDIVQESLVVIAGKFRDMEFETSFSAWAYRVLENKILEYYRKKHCHESKFAQMVEENPGAHQNAPDPTLQNRLLDCLKKINELNNRYARILNFQYQGYTTEETCKKLSVTRNNLYILLSRARSMLKLCLQRGDIR